APAKTRGSQDSEAVATCQKSGSFAGDTDHPTRQTHRGKGPRNDFLTPNSRLSWQTDHIGQRFARTLIKTAVAPRFHLRYGALGKLEKPSALQLQLPNEDVPEVQRVAVILQLDRAGGIERLVTFPVVFHRDVVSHRDAVQLHRHFVTDHLDPERIP